MSSDVVDIFLLLSKPSSFPRGRRSILRRKVIGVFSFLESRTFIKRVKFLIEVKVRFDVRIIESNRFFFRVRMFLVLSEKVILPSLKRVGRDI